MQSSMAVAGIDALSYPCENILTRRANQWHCSIIAPFERRPWPCPTTGSRGLEPLRADHEALWQSGASLREPPVSGVQADRHDVTDCLLTISACKVLIVRRCCVPFGEQSHVRPRTRTIKETPALQAAIAKPTRRTGPTSRADAEVKSPARTFSIAGSRINPQRRHSA